MADSEQPAAAAPPASTSLGQILRDARVAKDLTIDQLATELRIEARQLVALEDDRFEQIGVPVFVKGYIRQYAQRLGLDAHGLIELYGRQTKLEDVQIRGTKPIKLRDERQITVWVIAVLVLLLIGVGLAVWYLNAAAPGPVAGEPQHPAARVEPEPAATPEGAAEQVAAAPEPSPPAVAPAPAPDRSEPLPAAAAAAAPVPVTSAAEPGAAARRSALPGPTPISIDVTFDSESWAEITDARGQRLFFELGTAGRHVLLRGEPPVEATFGNGDAVRLLVDGERYPIPTQDRQGKPVRFSIASDEE